jgi:indole-3-glycerol phosphate synthase
MGKLKNKHLYLDEILKLKRDELASIKASGEFSSRLDCLKKKMEAAGPPRDFIEAVSRDGVRIIAEVKKASPSKGVIREDFDPVQIARTYEQSGAAAISVLTEEKYFLGSLDHLTRVRESVSLPVLRKDFIVDPYQVYESRAAGADSILLIVGVLTVPLLKELLSLSRELSMEALVEVHTEEELAIAVDTGARVIGINNRDLKSFTTDIDITMRLAGKVPEDKIIISESGIKTVDDIRLLKAQGVDAILIGEALVREQNISGKLREFLDSPS